MDFRYDLVEFSSVEQIAAVFTDSGTGSVPLGLSYPVGFARIHCSHCRLSIGTTPALYHRQ